MAKKQLSNMNPSIQNVIKDGVFFRLMATVAEFADDTKSVTAQMEKQFRNLILVNKSGQGGLKSQTDSADFERRTKDERNTNERRTIGCTKKSL